MTSTNTIRQYAHSRPVAAPRRTATDRSGKTSAQSQLAHWDEDWTLIADMTERRRIQNRIAQRNYRRRLKERLSRLEESATRLEDSSKHGDTDRHSKRPKKSQHTQPSHPQGLRPVESAPTDPFSMSSKTFYYNPMALSEERNVSTSYSISSNASTVESQVSTAGYTDFSVMFEDVMFEYPDSQTWRRATWPHA